MKKLFIIILSMLLFALPLSAWSLFSQAPSRPECVTDELNEILEDGKFERDAEQINTLTLNFTLAERQSIYDFYELDGSRAADDNFNWAFPAFGFGSFVQGDTSGGVFLLVTDIVTYAASITGTVVMTIGLFDILGITTIFFDTYDVDRAKRYFLGGMATAAIGVTLELLADCVYGAIRPRTYANTQNTALKNALGLGNSATSVSFMPVINPVQQSFGLAVSMQW